MVSTPEKLTMTPISLLSALGKTKLCAVVGRSAEVTTFQNTLRIAVLIVFRLLEVEMRFQPVGVVILSEFAPVFGKSEMLATMTSFKAVPVGVLTDSGVVIETLVMDVDNPLRVTVI